MTDEIAPTTADLDEAPAPEAHAPRSRRALLAGAVGGVAALAAGSLARPEPAAAASLTVGTTTSTSSTTRISSSATPAFRGDSSASGGKGLAGIGSASNGIGVVGVATSTGSSTNFGVLGEARGATGRGVRGVATHTTGSNIGVMGATSSPAGMGVYGIGARGVVGESSSPSGAAVVGRNKALTGDGDGVRAFTDTASGAGLYAEATALFPATATAITATSDTQTTVRIDNGAADTSATAVQVFATGTGIATSGLVGIQGQSLVADGRGVIARATHPSGVGLAAEASASGGIAIWAIGALKLSASGVATITTGNDTVLVSPDPHNPVTPTGFVIATPQNSPGAGIFISEARVGASNIVIKLSANATTNTKVAWLLLETP